MFAVNLFRKIVNHLLKTSENQKNQKMGGEILLLLHFLHSHFFFLKNIGAVSDEYEERFHKDIATIEKRYQER